MPQTLNTLIDIAADDVESEVQQMLCSLNERIEALELDVILVDLADRYGEVLLLLTARIELSAVGTLIDDRDMASIAQSQYLLLVRFRYDENAIGVSDGVVHAFR